MWITQLIKSTRILPASYGSGWLRNTMHGCIRRTRGRHVFGPTRYRSPPHLSNFLSDLVVLLARSSSRPLRLERSVGPTESSP